MSHDRLLHIGLSLPRTEAAPDGRTIDDHVSELFRLHSRNLTRSLRLDFRRDDAEEVTQEAFLRLHRAISIGTLIHDPRAWVLTVARRLMIDRVRLDAKFALPLDFDRQSTEPTQEDVWIDQRRIVAVKRAMRELTATERQCLIWRTQGLTLGEMGAILGEPDHRRVAEIIGSATRHIRSRLRE